MKTICFYKKAMDRIGNESCTVYSKSNFFVARSFSKNLVITELLQFYNLR